MDEPALGKTQPVHLGQEKPVFSVVMAVYNGEAHVEETLTSIFAQTFTDFELIFIDDSSTDSTLAIARRFAKGDKRMTILENPQNQGVAKSRNRGFAVAKGEFIAICDGDDLWRPTKLEHQLALLTASGCDLCYTGYQLIDHQGKSFWRAYVVPETIDYGGLLKENVIGCSTAAFRRRWINQFTMDSHYYLEDYGFWLRLLRGGAVAGGINLPLVDYRVHGSGRSANKWNAAKNRFFLLRKQENMGFFTSFYYMSIYFFRAMRKYKKES